MFSVKIAVWSTQTSDIEPIYSKACNLLNIILFFCIWWIELVIEEIAPDEIHFGAPIMIIMVPIIKYLVHSSKYEPYLSSQLNPMIPCSIKNLIYRTIIVNIEDTIQNNANNPDIMISLSRIGNSKLGLTILDIITPAHEFLPNRYCHIPSFTSFNLSSR